MINTPYSTMAIEPEEMKELLGHDDKVRHALVSFMVSMHCMAVGERISLEICQMIFAFIGGIYTTYLGVDPKDMVRASEHRKLFFEEGDKVYKLLQKKLAEGERGTAFVTESIEDMNPEGNMQ